MNNNEKKHSLLIISSEEPIALCFDSDGKYNLIVTHSAENALSIIHTQGAGISAIILDADLSDAGLLKDRIEKEKFLCPPIIALISEGEGEGGDERAAELKAEAFVVKPVDIKKLKAALFDAISRHELFLLREENRRLKAEAENRMNLEVLMDNLPGGVAVIETDAKKAFCTYYNNEVLKLFRMKGKDFIKEFEKSEPNSWLLDFMNRVKENDKLSYAFSLESADNSFLSQNLAEQKQWIRISAEVVGKNGDNVILYCVFLDVSEEKRQEQQIDFVNKKLHESEERMENIINNTPGALALCEEDENGGFKVLYCSKGLADIMGYDNYPLYLSELIENPTASIENPEEITSFKRALTTAIASGNHIEQIFKCKDYSGNSLFIMMRGKLLRGDGGRLALYCFVNDITKEKEYERELKVSAHFDALTGLYNRKTFYENAAERLKNDPDTVYSMMRLNIGSFKLINDLMGRSTGDRVLVTIADVLRSIIPESGIYARFFADNFVIMVPDGEIEPEIILGSVKREIEERKIIPHDVQYYIGIYKVTDRETSAEDICDRAAMACRSITGSLNQYISRYDESMRKQMLEEQEICDEAHNAILNNEFCIYYQSVYGIKAKRFVSAEALVRWNHPTKGLIPPGKFIPIFEKNGFIAELDLYVLEQVCKYQQKRRENGLEPFPVSVNISRMSLYNPGLFDIITGLTKKYGVDPKYFRIEITESAYNDNPGQLLETVSKLRERSYPVLMDDFGSGFSSLNTLKDIPIDMLKLDMKFMQDFEKNGKVGTIVTSVARMSKWLNLPMLAEGVETKEQFDFLESIGCSYIQGYLFAKPTNEEDFTRLIENNEYSASHTAIETIGIDEDINELLGNNSLISKIIGSVFGGIGIYEMSDDRLEVLRVNEGYVNIVGESPNDFTGEHLNIWDKLHPEDVEKSKASCYEAIKTGKAVRSTVRRYSRSGKMLYLDSIYRRLGGTEENPIFCIAFNDITEQIESDRIIRHSNDRIKEILNATGAFAIDSDIEHDTVFCSGDTDAYAFNPEQVERLINSDEGFSMFVHPSQREEMLEYHKTKASERASAEFLVKSKDGGYRWARFTKRCKYGENGEMLRKMAIINDIDEEKTARIALEKAKFQIDAAMENISSGVVITELDKISHSAKITFSNKAFWSIIGKQPDPDFDFAGFIKRGISEKDLVKIKDRALSGETNRFIFKINRDDGLAVWVELVATPANVGEAVGTSHMIIVSDITERYTSANKLEAIVDNYNGGLALVSRKGGEILLSYANDKFFQILALDPDDASLEKVNKVLLHITDYRYGSSDMEIITKENLKRIVKTNTFHFDGGSLDEENYVVTAEDVTLKRKEAVNRIAERSAYASSGLYDEVYSIDYKNRTSVRIFSRSKGETSAEEKTHSFQEIIANWLEKQVHPGDRKKASELLIGPVSNADFTDMYAQIRTLNPYSANKDDEYKTYGMVMVKSGTDSCMLFIKDMDRIDSSHTTAELKELGRIYRIVEEQTKTAVIELDHITGKITTSPTLSLFAASALTEEELSQKESYSRGLIVHPDDSEEFKKYIDNIEKDGAPIVLTVRLKMAEGDYKWCRITVIFVKNKAGETIKSISTVSIVHDEIEANKKAQTADALMRKTIKNIPMGAGIYRLDGTKLYPLYLSDNTLRMLGIEDPEKIPDFYDTKLFSAQKEAVLDKESEITFKHHREPDGDIWINSRYVVKQEGEAVIVYSALTDVTEAVIAKKKKSAEDKMYRMLLNETGTVIFYYDAEKDEFIYYGSAAEVENGYCVIENLMSETEKLTIFTNADRRRFIEAILKLLNSESEDSDELVVHMTVEGVLKHFRCFFKSISDENSKITKVIGKIDDIDDELAKFEEIKAKAMYDSLCIDIYNKSTTEELIKAKLDEGCGGALIMMDIDDFKGINDRFGHLFGDEFLKIFSSVLKKEFRESDIVGRYGGDEFCIFIIQANAQTAQNKCSELLKKLGEIEIPNLGNIKSSIGIAPVTADCNAYAGLLKRADSALYAAKNKGKNQAVLFDPDVMDENSYRSHKNDQKDKSIVLSSNPESFSSIIMRIFSALYSERDIEKGIAKIIELVGKTFDVSRVYIFENNEAGTHCSNTFEWCSEGTAPEINNLQNIAYADLGACYYDNFDDDNIFYCHDINSLVEAQREIVKAQGIKSMLQCAIMDDGVFKGYVGFDECRNNRFWVQEQIDALVFISKIISVFLLRGRNKRRRPCDN